MKRQSSNLAVFFGKYWHLFAVLLFIVTFTLDTFNVVNIFPRFTTKPPKLQNSSTSDFIYQAKNNLYTTHIGSTSTKKPYFRFQSKAGSQVVFSYDGVEEGRIDKKDGTVHFNNVDPNTDIVYTPLTNGLKEEIILKSPVTQYNATFNLDTFNAEPRLNLDGSYSRFFFDQNGRYQFHVEKPFAVDGKGVRTDDIKLSIRRSTSNPSQYQVMVEAPSAWLSDPTRSYPVSIDPTVVYDTSAEFAAGIFNRVVDTGSGGSPNLTTGYQELTADQYTVGLWHLNETSNDTCAGGQDTCDSSGNGYHATENGTAITTTSQRVGVGARNINHEGAGTQTDYLNTSITNSGSSKFSNGFTAEAWIYPTALDASHNTVMGQESGFLLAFNSSGAVASYVNTDNAWTGAVGGNCTVLLNTWSHIALTYDGENVISYLNGINCGSTKKTGPMSSAGTVYIGMRNPSGTLQPFHGTIDEARLSNKARTSEEIKLSASRRPYSVHTSEVIDMTSVSAWNSFIWTELGVATGDGETLKDSTSLVAQWNFNESSGTTATNNAGSCGASCNGTLTNFASTGSRDALAGSGWTTDNRRWGAGAIMFDGTNDFVSVSDSNYLTSSALTLETWINFSSLGTNDILFWKGAEYGFGYNYTSVNCAANKIGFAVYRNSAWVCVSSSFTPQVGLWYHLVGVYDGSTVKLYINGKLEGTPVAQGGSISNSAYNLQIGGGDGSGNYEPAISLDSSRLYSRALTSSEILSNYNSSNLELQTRVGADTSPNDGSWEEWRPITNETVINTFDEPYLYNNTDSGLIGYWPMDDLSGNATDVKGGNSGTPTGTKIVEGYYGKSRAFNGTSDKLDFGSPQALSFERTDSFSAEGWIKTSSLTNQAIASKFDAVRGWIFFVVSDGTIRLSLINTGSTNQIRCSTTRTVTDGFWHHVAFSYNGSSTASGVLIYIDGISQSLNCDLNNLNATIVNANANVNIGSQHSNTNYFLGNIDEVRLYNTNISSSLVQQHFLEGSTNASQLLISTDSTYKLVGDASRKIETGRSSVDANTVGLWHLDETSGTGAYLKDVSGNNLHGTPTGTSLVNGSSGKARLFNGTSDKISVSHNASFDFGTGNFSVEFWVKASAPTGWKMILGKVSGWASAGYGWVFGNDASSGTGATFEIMGAGTAGNYKKVTAPGVFDGTWHHIAGVRSGSTISIYKDGQLAGTNTSSINVNTNAVLSLGASIADNNYFYGGTLDEVRISNVARSAYEIAEVYRAGRSHYINKQISSTDITSKNSLPFYIAADRPGTYLQSLVGESPFANYQPDSSTVGLWHLDEQSSVFRDTFTGSSLTAKWTEIDPSGTINVNNGLALTSPGGWTTAVVSNATFSRAQGLTAYMKFTTGASLGYMMFGLANDSTTNASYSNITHAFYFKNGTFYHYQDGSSYGGPYLSGYTTNTTYEVKIVLTTSNVATYWIKGGAYTNWTLVTTDTSKSNTPLRVQVAQYSAIGTINEITVYPSSSSIKDSSGNGNHGTPQGTILNTQGVLGFGQTFTGLGDSITLPTYGIDTTAGGTNTVDFWMYWTGTNSSMPFGWNTTYDLWIQSSSCFGFNTGSGETIGAPLPQNQWVHVAAVFYNGTPNTSNVQLYINGQRQNLTYCLGSSSGSRTATTTAFISGWGNDANYKYNGSIDEFRISRGTRSADEIRQAFEIGLRTHTVTIDFGAKLDSGNLITDTNDLNFTVDANYYGLPNKGSSLYLGDKIIIKENVNGTESIAQGTVTAVTTSTGAVTVASWDAGSTVPSGGFTANASVFKWQREYWNITEPLDSHLNAISNFTLRLTDGNEGRTIWLDDFKSAGDYLTSPSGSNITSSTGNRYFQYRVIEHTTDEAVSANITNVTVDFTQLTPSAPTIGSPSVVSSSSIVWNYTDNSNNEDGFKLFDSAGNYLNQTSAVNSNSITETGLNPNTQYIRKVVSYNVHGNSAYSSTASTYTLANPPGQFSLTRTNTTTAQFALSANSNPESTTYAVYKEVGSSCDGVGGSYLNTNGADNGSTAVWAVLSGWGSNGLVTLSNLGTESTYTICIKAKNSNNTETAFVSNNVIIGNIVPISGDLNVNPGIGNSTSFLSRYRDGSDPSRYIIGLDNVGANSVNSSVLTVSGGSITINSNETLVAGSLNFTGGTMFIASGAKIAPGAKLWTIDRDADGYPDRLGGEIKVWHGTGSTPVSTISASFFRRKALLSTLVTPDCDDTTFSASNFCGLSNGSTCFSDNSCASSICGTDNDVDYLFSASAGHTGTCQAVALPYSDCDDSTANIGAINATGGTKTYGSGYVIHTFTSSGTFTLTCGGTSNVEYLVVGGGGGGGGSGNGYWGSGGGGGGGVRYGSLSLAQSAYTVTIGLGGYAGGVSSNGGAGHSSAFHTVSAAGGGYGARTGNTPYGGGSGGSGGGAAGRLCGGSYGGTGNTPSTSPAQGTNGGNCTATQFEAGAGGGGATQAGSDAGVGTGSNGGAGYTSSINGSSITYGSGGGGGGYSVAGSGGSGAGNGAVYGGGDGGSGTANRGGGGGGGGQTAGGAGGSGVVVVRYQVCSGYGTYYADTDGDGYGAGAGTNRCPSSGYVANNLDCDDTSASIRTRKATGGTITYSGTDIIHTFTSSGTFNLSCGSATTGQVLVVAGGGGGGGGVGSGTGGGGGGGGVVYHASKTLSGSVSVTVGNGGSGGANDRAVGSNGGNSVFNDITAIGGGGGGADSGNGVGGGSGGGGVAYGSYVYPGGGTQGTSGGGTGYGYSGARGSESVSYIYGGGGGGAGGNPGFSTPNGGPGYLSSITGSGLYYGGGGGGGGNGTPAGTGGSGVGGSGASDNGNATNGMVNRGGGGGGSAAGSRGNGGSGVVIVRYSSL